jgi:hypothetical protein
VFLVIANFIEWMVHRNPMHRPLRPRLLYKNHAQLHHLAFTDANMVIDRTDRPRPDHDALVHDARAVRRGVADHGDRRRGARSRGWRASSCWARSRISSATRRCTPSTTCPTRRWTAPASAGYAPSAACRPTTATITSSGRMAAVNFNVTVPLMDRLFGTLEK